MEVTTVPGLRRKIIYCSSFSNSSEELWKVQGTSRDCILNALHGKLVEFGFDEMGFDEYVCNVLGPTLKQFGTGGRACSLAQWDFFFHWQIRSSWVCALTLNIL